MLNPAHDDFRKNNPTVKVTYKKKPHGKIAYVNGETAYNMSDVYSFNTYEEQYEALERALKRARR